MEGAHPPQQRFGVHQRRYLRRGSTPRSGSSSAQTRRNADDGLLALLRRYPRWTCLGLIVAAVAAATRFAAIGILPPSIHMKSVAHARASTEVVVGPTSAGLSIGDFKLQRALSTRTYALADMVSSPIITEYVARAARLPASKIGVLGPLWWELWRAQQWASGPKRASQIVIERDPYQITIDQEAILPAQGPGPGPGPLLIDVSTQAPSTGAAVRLASAVPTALSAYVQHAQAIGGVPEQDRYTVRQAGRVLVAPAVRSQLANVALFTFFAVFLLWCGAQIATASLGRDLREAAASSKVGGGFDRSSNNGLPPGDPAHATI